jgi:IS1 family transposase
LRLDDDKVVQIVELLCEGVGVRAASRLTHCQHKTVLAVLNAVGQKCADFHDKTVRHLKVGALQVDELWAYVSCKQKQTTKRNKERGDFYTFLALTAREKLIVSFVTGKRDYRTTEEFAKDFAGRIDGRVQVTSDGWRSYPYLIRKYLLPRLDYAVMQKNYATPPAEVEASRRYSPVPLVSITREIKAGAPRLDRISTSFVERQNLNVRHFTKRFARLGLGWSKKLENHKNAVALFVCAHNFCKIHNTLGCTPAVGAKLTDHNWSIKELLRHITK